MPIHDLKCRKCGVIERDFIVLGDQLGFCPACESVDRERSYDWGCTGTGATWQRITVEGRTFATREEFEGWRSSVAQKTGRVPEFESNSTSKRIAALEENAHYTLSRINEVSERRNPDTARRERVQIETATNRLIHRIRMGD